MITKPEFTKPFDLNAAKAGAPYGCRDGRAAQVLKWDRNVSDYPLLGGIGESYDPRTWTITGSTTYGAHGNEYDCDLVMLPLGFIDGKPVFVGDEYRLIGEQLFASPITRDFIYCLWPAPAPMYPKTLIAHSVMFEEYAAHLRGIGYRTVSAESSGLAAVANFALRHAIDAGQVVLPGDTTARDMAAAVAVNNAAAEIAMKRHFAFGLDLPAIIAGVAK